MLGGKCLFICSVFSFRAPLLFRTSVRLTKDRMKIHFHLKPESYIYYICIHDLLKS
jgi:hypothetical protein